MRNRKRVLYTSFYTMTPPRDYTDIAKELTESLERWKLPHEVLPVEDKGSFHANVRFKPRFILQQMQEHTDRKYVCWIDADAVVVRMPTAFYRLYADLAVHWRDGVELLSGTMLWRNTPRIRQFLESWIKQCENGLNQHLTCPEQQILQKMLPDTNLQVFNLPTEYCKIFDRVEINDLGRTVDPIIIQNQASRKVRFAELQA